MSHLLRPKRNLGLGDQLVIRLDNLTVVVADGTDCVPLSWPVRSQDVRELFVVVRAAVLNRVHGELEGLNELFIDQ